MYRNIKAEQARKDMTNQQIADYLGICRKSYENKLSRGTFTVNEGKLLIRLFNKPFDYLFATDAPAT